MYHSQAGLVLGSIVVFRKNEKTFIRCSRVPAFAVTAGAMRNEQKFLVLF
jgi:hypothetical protein